MNAEERAIEWLNDTDDSPARVIVNDLLDALESSRASAAAYQELRDGKVYLNCPLTLNLCCRECGYVFAAFTNPTPIELIESEQAHRKSCTAVLSDTSPASPVGSEEGT